MPVAGEGLVQKRQSFRAVRILNLGGSQPDVLLE